MGGFREQKRRGVGKRKQQRQGSWCKNMEKAVLTVEPFLKAPVACLAVRGKLGHIKKVNLERAPSYTVPEMIMVKLPKSE